MADNIQATPRNYLGGLLTDAYKWMQSPERTQQMQGFAGLLGTTGLPQTIERMAYGEPLTNIGRANVPLLKPETADALMTVAPMVGPAARGAEAGLLSAGRAGERYAERVVPQVMERGGLPAQLLGDLSQGSIRPMDVWHGSPHGPFTKFDPNKIGSGEGAQAFSYGHYFGGARGTGEEYRRMLSTKVDVDGKPLYNANKIVGSTGNKDLDDYLVANLGDVKATRKNLLDDIKYVSEGNPEAAKDMQKTLEQLDKLNVNTQQAGYLYKVDLPDEAIAKMLDWDKPVSRQPNVMNALRSEAEQRVKAQKLADIENDIRASLPAQDVGDNYLAMFSDANVAINQDIQKQALEKLNKMDLKPFVDKELEIMKPVDMNWNMTGKEFYELLSNREGSPKKASELLQRQGVTGTRYLDQQSRGTSGGEILDVFETPNGWRSKVKVANRSGTQFDAPTDIFTTSMPFKTKEEATNWANEKIGSGTSNFVVFPQNEGLLTIKEINDQPVQGLLGR